MPSVESVAASAPLACAGATPCDWQIPKLGSVVSVRHVDRPVTVNVPPGTLDHPSVGGFVEVELLTCSSKSMVKSLRELGPGTEVVLAEYVKATTYRFPRSER